MIVLSVSEISALDGFCDQHEHEQELGILVVGYNSDALPMLDGCKEIGNAGVQALGPQNYIRPYQNRPT